MQTRSTAARPRLLMLTHCVPDRTGVADRARAWQLLQLANRTHDVCLAAIADRPINLQQWRALDAMTHRLAIEPIAAHRRALAAVATICLGPVGQRPALHGVLDHAARTFSQAGPFDATVFTHPAIWSTARQANAPTRLLDLPATAMSIHKRYGQRRRRRMIRWTRRVARLASHTICRDHEQARRFGRYGVRTTVLDPSSDQPLPIALRPTDGALALPPTQGPITAPQPLPRAA